MTAVPPPPINTPIMDDQGKPDLSWIIFFNALYEGDTGSPATGNGSWTPSFTNLTETGGSATLTGRYYRFNGRRLCYFSATITPVTNTSAVAGSTYINNFPLTFIADGIVFAVTGGSGSGSGHIVAANNRIYVPTWTNITTAITLVGLGEVL